MFSHAFDKIRLAMTESESGRKKYSVAVAAGVTVFFLTTYLIPWLRENMLLPCVRGIRDFFVMLGRHLKSSATIPWWSLWILIALSATIVLRIINSIRRGKSMESRKLDWRMFREFIYGGIRWTWGYSFSGDIIQLAPLCPVCSYQFDLRHDAVPDDRLLYGLRDVTRFWCDNCKEEKAVLDGDYKRVELRVKKEIHRLYNSGEWETIVRRQIAERSENQSAER